MPDNAPNTFRCAQCGGVFEKAWTDAEAAVECATLWDKELDAGEPFAQVCDDCFQQFMQVRRQEPR